MFNPLRMGIHETENTFSSDSSFERLRKEHLGDRVSPEKLEQLTARIRAQKLDERQVAVLFALQAKRLDHPLLAGILRSAATFVIAAEGNGDSSPGPASSS